ncbi:MAG TPA: CHAP domain-containing protein [Candidatus Paceibacterota bacterium]|nr:CHAP domain-containing protein [Candidatus Paceibacterota bacterium]
MHPENLETKTADVSKLGGKARAMIDLYLALPVGGKPQCPYFNNRRRKTKSQLRVLKGKGSPSEIAEEAEIEALHARVDIKTIATDKLKEFLIACDLGIDCSGFAYHVLNSLSQERTGKNIQSFVKSNRPGFVGTIAAKLRPAENMGVSTFANERNSTAVNPSEAKPGDIIVFIGTGKDGLYNHMVVVTGVERADGGTRISYAHSYAWPSDGTSGHGVREGDILVHGDDLLGGTWKEKGETGSGNYTYESARTAKSLSLRRLRFLA